MSRRPICGSCTIKLVTIAYARAPWFRLVREPLLAGMRFFRRVHKVHTDGHESPTAACHGCIRFDKSALGKKSASYRWLHGRLNPVFNKSLGSIVTDAERKQARDYAVRASAGQVSEAESGDWMRGVKHTL